MNNKRTMKFFKLDQWERPVYKCIETSDLWKDINLGDSTPDLYSCGNNIEGEPETPIKRDLEIIFLDQYKPNEFEFQYMMLSRLQLDCEYYLNNGNRIKKHLFYNDEKQHIEEMKKIYNSLPKKPEWLSLEKILEYEKDMVTI